MSKTDNELQGLEISWPSQDLWNFSPVSPLQKSSTASAFSTSSYELDYFSPVAAEFDSLLSKFMSLQSSPSNASLPLTPASPLDISYTALDYYPIEVAPQKTEKRKRGRKEDPGGTCSVCNRTFKRIYDLKRHLRIHLENKPFQCKDCGRGFTRTDTLAKHISEEYGCKFLNDGRKRNRK